MGDESAQDDERAGDVAPDDGVPDDGGLSTGTADPHSLVSRFRRRLAVLQDRPLASLVVGLIDRDREGAGSVVGSAIAFRLFLFFVPLLLFVVGVAGLLSGHVSAHSVSHEVGVSGSLDAQIRHAFDQSAGTGWVSLGLGLLGMAWAGRSLSRALIATSYRAWGMPIVGRASWRIVGAVAGLIAGMGLISIFVNRVREALGLATASLSFVPALLVYAVGWYLLSLLLPRRTDDPAAVLPGAVVVALVITGMQAVSQFYLPGRFERAGQLYGALGSTIVTLGWFFILGRAVVLALELNPLLYDRYGSLATAFFSLPLLRLLPRRSARLRRLFDLDEPG